MPTTGKFALLVANGILPSQEVLASLLTFDPFILAADGGANKLLERGIIADAVIGDFDSLGGELPETVVRIHAPDQDYTDLDKAVGYLKERGYQTVWIVGSIGDRLDHTVGALSVLIKYRKDMQIALIDDIATAAPVDGTLVIDTNVGQVISLLALGEVTGITTTGLRWNLDNDALTIGVRDGISNVAEAEEVSITVANGALIVYAFHG